MRVLCICDQGNNRSVQFAHLLKYKGHETLSAGLRTNTEETLTMLYRWAEVIITTDKTQEIPMIYQAKVKLWDVGEDRFPRPFNKDLLVIAKKFIEENPL